VVLVPFPFTDLSAIKQRPALVLSPDRSNEVRPDLVVAAITSQIPTKPGDDEVLLSGNELKKTGLPKPSNIKLSKIFTIHQGLISKKEWSRVRFHARRDFGETSAIASMKSKFTQRRYRASKQRACGLCKPQKQGWADKKTFADARQAT